MGDKWKGLAVIAHSADEWVWVVVWKCGFITDSTSTQIGLMAQVEEEVDIFLQTQPLPRKVTFLIMQTHRKTELSCQWPLLTLGPLEWLKWLLLGIPTLTLIASYQVIWPFVIRFAFLLRETMCSHFRGHVYQCVTKECLSILDIHSNASRPSFILGKTMLPFVDVLSFVWAQLWFSCYGGFLKFFKLFSMKFVGIEISPLPSLFFPSFLHFLANHSLPYYYNSTVL